MLCSIPFAYYKNDNCLYVVDGSSDKMTIFNKIVEILTNK